MENLKETTKQIRKISNRTTLPLLVYCVLYILFTAFVPEFVTDFLRSNGISLSDSADTLLRYILIYLMIVPLAILAFRLTSGKKGVRLTAGFRKPEKSFKWCAKWTLIAMGASTILGAVPALISMVLQMIFGTSASPTISLFSAQRLTYINLPDSLGILIPTLIFAPIFEECLFRGQIFKNNLPLGEFFAIIVSGMFFGLWHQNLPQVCTTAFFGMFACFIYLRTKSIFPSMIAHFFNNFMVILRDLIASNIDLTNIKVAPFDTIIDNIPFILLFIVYSTVLTGVIVTGVVFFIIEIVKRKEFKFEKSPMEISSKRKVFTFFTAPVTLVVTIYLVTISVLNTIFGYFWFLK